MSAPVLDLASTHARIAALASDRAVHRAFNWLHLNELRIRQWQLAAVAIPAPTFAESARAAWFLDRFTELGLTNPHIDAAGNVLATLPASPDSGAALSRTAPRNLPPAPAILLSAHLDTVFPAATDTTPLQDGPLIHAPGICDNAAGLAALLAIAAALRHAEIAPPCPILFCANVGEEGEGDLSGMRHLFAPGSPHRIAAAIALEGAGTGVVVDRALGSRRLRITLSGPGGHSWADANQPNPIFVLSEALASLGRLPLPQNPRTTLHCGTIQGGTSVNSVPESVTATLDLRSTDSAVLAELADTAQHLLEATVRSQNARTGNSAPLTLNIETIGNRPAGALPPGAALYTSLRAVDRHLRIRTEPRVGSTDANLPLALGTPALAIGTGGSAGGIHTLAEWFDPTGRTLALRRILLHLLDTCTLTSVTPL